MSLTYQFNELTNNIENKILLKNLYVKFFIRNKLDKITFIIENEFFFFNVDQSILKKNINIKEKKNISYLKNEKQYALLLKKINKKTSGNSNKEIIINKSNGLLSSNEKYQENIKLIGFSILLKETLLKHKNYKNLQIYFFLKKRIFINTLKFQFLFFKMFFKILEMKIPLIGSIVKIIKGGYVCEINFLTVQAYLSNSCFQNQEKNYRAINNFALFYDLKSICNPLENISIFYSFCFLKSVNLNLTLLWNSPFFFNNKFLFPLYFFVISKFLAKESKFRIKSLFKFKKSKRYGKLKKKTFIVRRKFRFKTLKIFLSTQNNFKKKKLFFTKELILSEFEKKCKILAKKIINFNL